MHCDYSAWHELTPTELPSGQIVLIGTSRSLSMVGRRRRYPKDARVHLGDGLRIPAN